MISVTIKKFVPVDGVDHIATTWQIATDEGFKNIVENVKSVKYLNGYESDIIIPEGLVYWVRAKRHFNKPNIDYFTEPAKVISNSSEITNMVLDKEIHVDVPVIYVNEEELVNHEVEYFTVKTSEFRSTTDMHVATSWFVRTVSGDLLFTSLDNKENKTEIKIRKTPSMKVESDLVISAIHIGSSGVESKLGSKIVKVVGYQYKLLTSLEDVQPYVDLTVYFASQRPDGQTKILKITVEDAIAGGIIYETQLGRNNTITIPWNRLKFGSMLYLNVHCYDNHGIFGISRHIITTRSSYVTPVESIHKDYKDNLEKLSDRMYLAYRKPVTTMETPMGYIPYIKDNDLNVYKYKVNTRTGLIENNVETLNGVSLVTVNPDNINIRYTQDDILIIDTMETNNAGQTYPVFMVYSYLRNKDSYILVSKIKRKDEIATTGVLNNLVQYSATDFYYVPLGKSELRRLDLANNRVTRVIDLPSDKFINANLIWLPMNKFLVMGKDSYCRVYDVLNKKFLMSVSTPLNFKDWDRKQLQLPNGDTLLIKVGDDSSDTTPSIIKFSYKTKNFKEIGSTIPYKTLPTSIVLMMDDSVYLHDYIAEEDLEFTRFNSEIVDSGWYGYKFN